MYSFITESQDLSLVGPVVRVADDDVALDGDGHHGVHRPGQGDVDGGQQDRRLISMSVHQLEEFFIPIIGPLG